MRDDDHIIIAGLGQVPVAEHWDDSIRSWGRLPFARL